MEHSSIRWNNAITNLKEILFFVNFPREMPMLFKITVLKCCNFQYQNYFLLKAGTKYNDGEAFPVGFAPVLKSLRVMLISDL